MAISFVQEAKRFSFGSSSVLIKKAAALWLDLSNNQGYSELDIREHIAQALKVPVAVVVFWQTAHGWKIPQGVGYHLLNAEMLDDEADAGEDALADFYKNVIAGASNYASDEKASSAQMIIYKAVRSYFHDVAYLSPSNAPIDEVMAVIADRDLNLKSLALLYGMRTETMERYLVIHHGFDRKSLHHNRVAIDWGEGLRDPFLTKILYRTWAGLYEKGLPLREIGRRYSLKEEIIIASAQDLGDLWPKCDPEFLDLLRTWLMSHLAGYREAHQKEMAARAKACLQESMISHNNHAATPATQHAHQIAQDASSCKFEQTSLALG